MELLDIGKTGIEGEEPNGMDIRYEPEFEELQTEIDKLSSPSASGAIDWPKVSSLAGTILSAKSKDLLVGSYFAVSQIYVAEIEGLTTGLQVYHDLLNTFWDTLFPEKKRMRGRIAAIEWWLEKSDKALQALEPAKTPVEDVEHIKDLLLQIDSLLVEYLDEPPLLQPIRRFVDSIPLLQGEDSVTDEADVTEKAEIATEQKTEPQHTDKHQNIVTENPAVAQEVRPLNSSGDPEKLMRSSFQTILQVAEDFINNDLSDPRGYRWARVGGWSMIQDLPPHKENKTLIPPPAEYNMVYKMLSGLRNAGNWETLLKSSEKSFKRSLLWLDLNRFTVEALDSLGDQYLDAHAALNQETSSLVNRLSGIENLYFSDGTPLADPETKQWLESISSQVSDTLINQPMISGGDQLDNLSETIEKAQELVKEKKLPEAVRTLQKELQRSFSSKERLLWRMSLSQLLIEAKKPKLAMPQLEGIIEDIDHFQLEEWDPELALKALRVVWLGLKTGSDAGTRDQLGEIVNRIAKLDPAEALLL